MASSATAASPSGTELHAYMLCRYRSRAKPYDGSDRPWVEYGSELFLLERNECGNFTEMN